MDSWAGWIAVLAVGLVLLLAAAWLDLQRRRNAEGGTAAPERGDESVDAQQPDYVPQSRIDELPLPGRGGSAPSERPGLRLGFGHAGAEFATAGGVAVLEHPRILLVDGEITTMRELFPALSPSGPAVVVAAVGISEETLSTLRANRKALAVPVLAALPSRRDLYELASITGAEVLTVDDLKAGYLPSQAFGTTRQWTSTDRATWVVPVAAGGPPA